MILVLIMIFLLFSPQAASAHPHGWLEVKADFVLEDQKITEIKTEWEVDELNSLINLEDKEKIQVFFFETMKKKNFFSVIKINGTASNAYTIEDFRTSVRDDLIILNFSIQLNERVDADKLVVSFYDPRYYYDVYFGEQNPVKFINDKENKYKYRVEEDLEFTYYFNTVNPQIVRIYCRN